jgi:3-hydroxybutyryl-CoA dehydrogenase
MQIKHVGVIGAGTMGNGIAHAFAVRGFAVSLIDTTKEILDRAMFTIAKNMDRQVRKEIISVEDKSAALARIATATDLQTARGADLVIEAAFESLEVKLNLFLQMDTLTRPETILASNTSSLPITQLAGVTGRPEKVIGMHFMNPVPMMKLIEIIRGHVTSDETFQTIFDLCGALGKTGVEVNDYPGFVSNRLLMPMINEAIFAVHEGVATPEAVDTVMKLGMAHPMGPLALADFIGLDVCLAIMGVLYEGFADSKYRPCPLLRKMVHAGHLGCKSGRGFYVYDKK